MSTVDRAALVLSLLTVLASAFVAASVFEQMAHLEDEFAYVWQAQAYARGDLTLPSPEFSDSFLVPFVVDHEGQRFGKYPMGWPAMLSLGVRAGIRSWINPLLAGWAVWLIYRLGKRLQGEMVGLLSAGLTVSSPFFLMNTGSLLSHPMSLVLTLIFMLSWMGILEDRKNSQVPAWMPVLGGGMSLGLLGLTRPVTMAAVALPYGIYGAIILFRGTGAQRKRVWIVGGTALLLAGLHFVWQRILTGHFFQNPYTLWWPYDRLGFGPGHGVMASGHTLKLAWWNTKHSLRTGLSDLFGWGKLSWLFIPFGLWALRKRKQAWLMAAVPLSLVLLYAAYWVGAWLLGPRYYFAGLPALVIFSASGILFLAGKLPQDKVSLWTRRHIWKTVRLTLTASAVLFLVAANLRFYLPTRLASLHGLYGIKRSILEPFTSQQVEDLAPALMIVHAEHWTGYGNYLELTTPYFDTPFLFAWSIGPKTDAALTAAYSDQRDVYHYYPGQPDKFYTSPKPGSY